MNQKERFDEFYGTENLAFGEAPPPELRLFVSTHRGPHRSLDLGCGDGRITLYLATAGHHVTGVDLSPVALDKLRAVARRRGLENNITLLEGDIRNVDHSSETYDLVVAATVLDHLPKKDIAPAFENIVRSIKRGGTLFVRVHNVDDPGRIDAENASELREAIEYYFAKQELLGLAGNLFEILSYREDEEEDRSHGEPHTHAFSTLFARRL
jgi:SAM-dependent methyltransferase